MATSVVKKLVTNRKGYSALLATIIMVLVAMFLFFNVFMYMQSRNMDYQDAAERANQLDTDQAAERRALTVSVWKQRIGLTSNYNVYCSVSNSGAAPIVISRVWVRNVPFSSNLISTTPQISIIPPGATVEILGSSYVVQPRMGNNYQYTVTLVTSMGNVVSDGEPATP